MARKPYSVTPRPPAGNINAGSTSGRTTRARTTRNVGTPGQSLRVKLEGCRTLEEAFAMIEEAFSRMADAGIPKLKNMYFYSTPCDADEDPLMKRTPIPDIVIEKVPAYRSAAEKYKAP
jgi:hypothetical protein